MLIVLLLGCLVGLVNGLAVVALGLSPIVATLAVNGILQGLALLYSGGTPAGFAPPLLRSFMTGHLGGVTPVVLFVALFAAAAVLRSAEDTSELQSLMRISYAVCCLKK